MKIKICLICGGPSSEKSISLNSTRSVIDNLDKNIFDLSIIYFDLNKKPYKIPSSEIYSNTVSDFEFKIKEIGKKLKSFEFIQYLKKKHIVWPIIHGEFGEDGEIQKILEKNNIKFIGSNSKTCKLTLNKFKTQEYLKKNNFFTFGTKLITKKNLNNYKNNFKTPFIIKPNRQGSSIGVNFVNQKKEFLEKAKTAFNFDTEIVMEKKCPGKEFTLIIVENKNHEVTPLIPTEIEFVKKNDKFFNFRKKYLASYNVHLHTPPRFNQNTQNKINHQASKVFELFKLKDIARLDGWVMKNGEIWFSDINSIPGMEQNSFIFRQSAVLGLNHKDFLQYVIFNSLVRNTVFSNKELNNLKKNSIKKNKKKKVAVIFGGQTAEKQISLLSGTNVWIKLKSSKNYSPNPILLDQKLNYWLLPHYYCLHHTVEEIEYLIKKIDQKELEKLIRKIKKLRKNLNLNQDDYSEPLFLPKKLNLSNIAKNHDFTFLGLHGGIGEDGTLQKKLEKLNSPYNGPSVEASKIGMDKYQTANLINKAKIKGLNSLKKIIIQVSKIDNCKSYYQKLKTELKTSDILLKPRGDGCSAGVVKINDHNELKIYLEKLKNNSKILPGGLLKDHPSEIELPMEKCEEVLAERYIKVDKIEIKGKKILRKTKKGWMELSVAVLGTKNNLKALTPSQTIAMGKVLTVEEKFQGGTGINFTPPPNQYINKKDLEEIKNKISKAAKILKIEGYSRIDCFYNLKSKEVVIIEANTLPAMTPSTIIYHQALKEMPPISPLLLIEKIIKLGFQKNKNKNFKKA